MMSSLFDVASAEHAAYFIVTVFLNILSLVQESNSWWFLVSN